MNHGNDISNQINNMVVDNPVASSFDWWNGRWHQPVGWCYLSEGPTETVVAAANPDQEVEDWCPPTAPGCVSFSYPFHFLLHPSFYSRSLLLPTIRRRPVYTFVGTIFSRRKNEKEIDLDWFPESVLSNFCLSWVSIGSTSNHNNNNARIMNFRNCIITNIVL